MSFPGKPDFVKKIKCKGGQYTIFGDKNKKTGPYRSV